MSRSPDGHNKFAPLIEACEAAGIFFEVDLDDTLHVDLQGWGEKFSLTDWFAKELGYPITASFEDYRNGCNHTERRIVMGLPSLAGAENFITILLHEMGHGFRSREEDLSFKDQWDHSDMSKGRELFRSTAPLKAKSERVAWEWTLEKLGDLYQEHGWDIRQLFETPDHMIKLVTQSYTIARDIYVARTKQFAYGAMSMTEAERLAQEVSDNFDMSFIEPAVENLWKRLS